MADLTYGEIASMFKSFVKTKDRWSRMKLYKNCFIASKAVDFLVDSGIAEDRLDAVKIGRHLQLTENLFSHVVDKQKMFEDEYIFFRYNCNPTPATTPTWSETSLTDGSTTTTTTPPKQREQKFAPDPVGDLSFASYARKISARKVSEGENGCGHSLTAREAGRYARTASFMKQNKENSIMPDEKEVSDGINDPFETEIKPDDMRCLALVAHNHMKPAMKSFIEDHSEILKKFRLTGTNTTMTMCRTIFGADNPDVVYGPTCTSGPLGGDAQLCALMCLEDVGAIIFFMDPLSAHPHQADIDALVRLANVHNIMLCPNPATGYAAMWMFRNCLSSNRPEMIPSFFETLESPAVPEYKAAQEAALSRAVNGK